MNQHVYLLMSLFQVIAQHGADTERGKTLEGIEAISGPDGYDLWFLAEGVEFHVGFHNTLGQVCKSGKARDEFLLKAQRLVDEYASPSNRHSNEARKAC